MKYLKLYEKFDENDPFGEEMEYIKPDGTFLSWLKRNYPDENIWNKITRIDCSSKNLTSLEGIENLVNLKELCCSRNQLTSLEGIKLKNLVNLERVDCHSNQLTNLEGIEDLVNLKELFCYNNQLTIEYKNHLRNYCEKRKIHLVI